MSWVIALGLAAFAVAAVEGEPTVSKTLRGAEQVKHKSFHGRMLQEDELPTCRNGIVGITSSNNQGDVCCHVACGQCGGVGCSAAGGSDYGADACCVSAIKDYGELCSVTGVAPCIIDPADDTGASDDHDDTDDAADDYCSNGIPGIMSLNAEFCCERVCGQCGGPGCTDFAEGHVCCVSDIDESGVMCSAFGEAPCIIDDDDTITPAAPVPSPSEPADPGTTAPVQAPTAPVQAPTAPVQAPTDPAPAPTKTGDIDGDGEIDGYAYEGCYENPVEDPFTSMMTDDAMTPQMCFEVCARTSARYMGVLDGRKCGCGNDPHIIQFGGMPGTCDMACAGSTSHTCGGSESWEEYRLVDYNIGLDDENATGGLMECSNGIPGVESASGDVCCGASCGSCGGSRCVGTGSCCEEYIKDKKEPCEVVGVAPCVINDR